MIELTEEEFKIFKNGDMKYINGINHIKIGNFWIAYFSKIPLDNHNDWMYVRRTDFVDSIIKKRKMKIKNSTKINKLISCIRKNSVAPKKLLGHRFTMEATSK